jgi:hypothetical protein
VAPKNRASDLWKAEKQEGAYWHLINVDKLMKLMEGCMERECRREVWEKVRGLKLQKHSPNGFLKHTSQQARTGVLSNHFP